jgi:hypothetical protein
VVAQERYARWLAHGSRVALAGMAIAFVAYVSGAIPASVPLERVPQLWAHSAREYLQQTGVHRGWDWIRLIARSEGLNLAGIVLLSCCAVMPLAAVIPIFKAKRQIALLAICALQIAVVVLAASGIFGLG